MINHDNDTLNASQKKTDMPKVKKSEAIDSMVAKLIASAVVGMGVGAGTAYAAVELSEPEVKDGSIQPAEPTVEERLAKLEEQELLREQQEEERQQHEQERQAHELERQRHDHERTKIVKIKPTPTPVPEPEKDFFEEHVVEVLGSIDHTLSDGSTVTAYIALVDGHQAAFLENGNGQIQAVIIDTDDNGISESDIVVDLSKQHVTVNTLAQYVVEPPVEPEVDVIAVHHDVDFNGTTVDLAEVKVDGEEVLLVDARQNGEVDLTVADSNHNGDIEDNEIRDVSDSHIPMPTEADVNCTMTTSLDSDVTNDSPNNTDLDITEV